SLPGRGEESRPDPLAAAEQGVAECLLELTQLGCEWEARELGLAELLELAGLSYAGPSGRARSTSAWISFARSARLCSTSTACSGSSVASSWVRALSSRSSSSCRRATDSGSWVLTVSPPLPPCRGCRSPAWQRPPTLTCAQAARPRLSPLRVGPRRGRARRGRSGGCSARA